MKRKAGYLVGTAWAATLLAVPVHAQTTPPTGGAGLDGVLQELRLLRRAVERQNVVAARMQLLLARLSLQDQRVARSRQSVERLEADLAGAQREQSQLQSTTREMARALEEATDATHRQSLEQESRLLRSRLADSNAAVQSVQARLAQARQALDADAARYDELEGWLADVERELQRDGS
jgi:chromosome segregation ATPase